MDGHKSPEDVSSVSQALVRLLTAPFEVSRFLVASETVMAKAPAEWQ
jgi:hypothetical protein